MQHYENVKQCLAKHSIPQGRQPLYVSNIAAWDFTTFLN